ncbi:MAG: T9SS type A sorting domain-containing protein [Rhodothermales bacterium]
MTRFFILIIVATLALPVRAQTGNCDASMAEAELDINNVRARILNNGGLFWRGGASVYEVPKYGATHAVFSAGIWVGGLIDGELRITATRYGPWEMWAGPLDEQGVPPQDCAPFDKIYNIYNLDLVEYDSTGVASDDLLNWPWHLGAPVVDGDGNPDNYNLQGGDRPEIMGHQTLWWIMNDKGNVHEATASDPIGLEVHVTAFAAASSNEHINNATLYRYKLIHKGESPLEEAYIGLFLDSDLGNFDDDYVGADTTLGLGYTYNGDNLDEGERGYGEAPPAVGYDLIQGPLVNQDGVDNDRDGDTDEEGERLSMTSFVFFNSGEQVNGDPAVGSDYYNYLSGKWRNGDPITIGDDGYDFSDLPTSFIFPGDPVTGTGWTEINPDPFNGTLPPKNPADRRTVAGSGPFTLTPQIEQEIVFAVLWARGEDNLDSITKLREASVAVQEAYDTGFNIDIDINTEPLQPVQLFAPINGVDNQPIDPTLFWNRTDNETAFMIEWAPNDAFTDAFTDVVINNSLFLLPDLSPNTTYYWRIRAFNAQEQGPWSDTWQFSTADFSIGTELFDSSGFMAVANAAGPITPPDMAAFAFNNSGFPILEGNLTPAGSYTNNDRPNRGIQQSTNMSAWGIHTGGDRYLFDDDNGESFIERSLPNGRAPIGEDLFEWRFPQQCLDQINGTIEQADCLAMRTEVDSTIVEIPFELWNIGTTDTDPGDDYRMIPMMCEESCEAGIDNFAFDIANDHQVSGGNDDPYSDWISWFKPADNGASPGEQGYRDFFFGDAGLGDEVFSRMVLVQWNGGDTPPYEVTLPEPGTIFRIQLSRTSPPLLSSPRNNEIRQSRFTSLSWNAPPAIFHLQISTSADFSVPLIENDSLSVPYFNTAELSENQTYYWRVKMFSGSGFELSDWSDPWQFTIPLNVGTTSSPTIPINYSLAPSYPNPFTNTTNIRYALPQSTFVRLEIFDTLGRRVNTLENRQQPAGWHEISFDAAHLPNGVYFYRLTAGNFTDTKTMILMR